MLSSILMVRCGILGQLICIVRSRKKPFTFSLTAVHSARRLFSPVLRATGDVSVACVGTSGLAPADVRHPGSQPGGPGIITCAGNLATIWTDVTLTSSWTIVTSWGDKAFRERHVSYMGRTFGHVSVQFAVLIVPNQELFVVRSSRSRSHQFLNWMSRVTHFKALGVALDVSSPPLTRAAMSQTACVQYVGVYFNTNPG